MLLPLLLMDPTLPPHAPYLVCDIPMVPSSCAHYLVCDIPCCEHPIHTGLGGAPVYDQVPLVVHLEHILGLGLV